MAKLAWLDDSNLLFHCPGCHYPHYVRIAGPGPVWEWNGSLDLPTFMPEITFSAHNEAKRCRLLVQNGRAEFLSDCHHGMKDLTVTLPEWPGDGTPSEQPAASNTAREIIEHAIANGDECEPFGGDDDECPA